MLRWILAFVLGWGLFRMIRGLSASVSSPPRKPRGRTLDPERAVEASWEEVPDDGADSRPADGEDAGTR